MTSGAKMRVYEIAKELDIPNKELIAKIRALGLEVNNHMSSLDADEVARVKRSLERERVASTETKRLSSTVLRRRSKNERSPGEDMIEDTIPEPAPPEPARPVLRRPSATARTAPPEKPAASEAAPPVRTAAAQTAPQRRESTEPARPSEPEREWEAQAEHRPVEAPARSEAPPRAPAPVETAPAPVESAPARPAMAERASQDIEEPVRPPARSTAGASEEGVMTGSQSPPSTEQVERPREAQASQPAEEQTGEPGTRPERRAETRPERRVESESDTREARAATRPEPTAERSAPAASSQTGERASARAASRAVEQPIESPRQAAEAAAAPEPAATPAQPGATSRRPRSPVIVQGPPVVQMGGARPAPAQERPQGRPAAAGERPGAPSPTASGDGRGAAGDGRGAAVRARPSAPSAPSAPPSRRPDPRRPEPATTVQDVADNARSRFEQELERARKRVSEREAADRRRREVEPPTVDEKRDPARPAVGTVISLPSARIKITERKPTVGAPQRPGGPPVPPRGGDRFATRGRTQQQTRGGPGGNKRDQFARKRPLTRKPGQKTLKTTPAEHKRVIRMEETIAISELARGMGVKANEVLKKLWGMGMLGVNINASIDHETAQIMASEFGYEVQNVAFKEDDIFQIEPDEQEAMVPRSPVVTIMGHVDHGKTSLLDAIRKTRVAAGEAGGITQHIAAYKVSAGEDFGDIVFLDTPGHEAFTAMRARGAQATDIAVLVVAADDGVMPQTLEALSHAKDAEVSVIVAVNKSDLPNAQPERVRQQLAEHGLIPEEWGGDTIYVDVSAYTGDGLDKLLESIALNASLLDLRANPEKPARGVVIEAKLDRARGPMATVLVQEGTLRTGDVVVAGRYYGKVRALLDDKGNQIKEAGPSTPVELLGLDGVPDAGDTLNGAEDEKSAKQVVEHRRQAQRKRELATTGKVSFENLMERINEGEIHELKIVLKADVQGSAEALKVALIKQTTEKVKVNVIQAGVGGITESDVNLAKAGGALIVGFHVRPAGKSAKHAEQEGVEIRLYDVIYECLEEMRAAMAGLLAPIKREHEVGKMEVRDTFTIPKMGTVAGCMVIEGKVVRKSLLRVIRDAVLVYEGRVGSLRRFKDDVSEVKEGYECGLVIQGFNDIKVGDIVESYEIIEEAAKL
jgi:translation initiation factor IF-2